MAAANYMEHSLHRLPRPREPARSDARLASVEMKGGSSSYDVPPCLAIKAGPGAGKIKEAKPRFNGNVNECGVGFRTS